jgi:hypothetical protein
MGVPSSLSAFLIHSINRAARLTAASSGRVNSSVARQGRRPRGRFIFPSSKSARLHLSFADRGRSARSKRISGPYSLSRPALRTASKNSNSARLTICGMARVGPDVLLGGAQFDASRIALSIYAPIKLRTVKVFSAHLTNQPAMYGSCFYRYLNGQLGVMSWKRGDSWERMILAEQAIPLTIEQAIAAKVFPMVYPQLRIFPGPTKSVH